MRVWITFLIQSGYFVFKYQQLVNSLYHFPLEQGYLNRGKNDIQKINISNLNFSDFDICTHLSNCHNN